VVVVKILLKRGFEINRESFVPSLGEPLISIDKHRFYIGDGETPGGRIPIYFLDDLEDVIINLSYYKVIQDHWNYDSSARYFLGMDSSNIWRNFLIDQTDLPYHINVKRLADGSVTNEEFQYLKDTTANIQWQLNYKASIYGTPNYYFQLERKNFGPLFKNALYTDIDSSSTSIIGNFPEIIDPYNPLVELRNFIDDDYGSLRVKSLIVDGTIGFINIYNLDYWDTWIYLSRNTTGIPMVDCGIRVVRGVEADARLYWDESNNIWKVGTLGNEYEIVNTHKVQNIYNKTLFSPILVTPRINDYRFAQHTHINAVQGGKLTDEALSIPVRPIKGGTGKDSRYWNGIVKVEYGNWYAEELNAEDLPPHIHDHDNLINVTEDQHHPRLHDLDSDQDHYGILSSEKGGTGFDWYGNGQFLMGNTQGTLNKVQLITLGNIFVTYDGTFFGLGAYAGYDTIKNDFWTFPKRTTIRFSGSGILINDDEDNTHIRVHDNLESIAAMIDEEGILVRRWDTVLHKYEIITRKIETPLSISISDTYLDIANSEGRSGDIRLYIGQRVVTTDTDQYISGLKTILYPILIRPDIKDFSDATHSHETSIQGGKLTEKSLKPSILGQSGKFLVVHDDNNIGLYGLVYRSNPDENLVLQIDRDALNKEIQLSSSWTGSLSITRAVQDQHIEKEH